jgi:hypothetical protein
MRRHEQNDNAPLVKRGSTDIYIADNKMTKDVEPNSDAAFFLDSAY